MNTSCAIDTNILIYALDANSEHHERATAFLRNCMKKGYKLHVSSQVIPESINVLVKFLDQKPAVASAKLEYLLDRLRVQVLYPRASGMSMFNELTRKIATNNRTFDVFMAAVLVDRDIELLYSYNLKDFGDIPYMKVLSPDALK